MLEKGRIGNYQLFLLVLFIILPTAILFVPAVTTAVAQEGGWLATALASGVGMVIASLFGAYFRFFPEQNLLEISSMALGKWLGRIVGLGYIWFLFQTNAIIIREFGEFLTTAVMPETPLSVFIISITLLSAWAVYQGLEVIGRMNEFVFPLLTLATLIVIVLVLREAEFSRLSPLTVFNWKSLLAASMIPASWMGEIVLVTLFIPFVYQAQKSWPWMVAGIMVVGAFLLAITMAAIVVFGHAEASRLMFPTYSLARIISISNIIERMESLVMAVWVAGVFLKITIWFYALVLLTAQTFGLKTYKPLILPYAFAQIALSFWLFKNITGLFQFISTTWPVYSISTFEVGIPLLILVIALIRRRGREGSAKNQA
ncbi:MAG: endospore germination permease [Thermoanaerobacteraceae bacterium]|nr:endospore germination permease [Thermoanaerobacteraceae bacterium]